VNGKTLTNEEKRRDSSKRKRPRKVGSLIYRKEGQKKKAMGSLSSDQSPETKIWGGDVEGGCGKGGSWGQRGRGIKGQGVNPSFCRSIGHKSGAKKRGKNPMTTSALKLSGKGEN